MTEYIDFINVGFGEATFIQLKDLKNNQIMHILVDAGTSHKVNYQKDQRRYPIEQYLIEHQIHEIDLVIITHFHEDHIGGLLQLLITVKIKKIIMHTYIPQTIRGIFAINNWAQELASLDTFIQLIKEIHDKRIPYEVIAQESEILFGEYLLTIFMPLVKEYEQVMDRLEMHQSMDVINVYNNLKWVDSVMNLYALSILLLKRENPICLLTADVHLSSFTKKEIKDIYILQAPHHGDSKCIDNNVFIKMNPKYFIISADSQNTYNLPSFDIQEKITSLNQANVLYTETSNSIHRLIRLDLNSMEVTLEMK